MNTKSELKEEVGEDNRDFIVHVECESEQVHRTVTHYEYSANLDEMDWITGQKLRAKQVRVLKRQRLTMLP